MVDLTTSARVKLLLQPQTPMGSTVDSTISQLITEVTATFEAYCDRKFEYTARTQYFNVDPGQTTFPLSAWGAMSKSATTVYHDTAHETDTYTQFPASTAVDKGLWALDTARGLLVFDNYELLLGPNVLKVTYTAGIATNATSAANMVSGFPDLALACEREVIRMFRTSTQPELTNYSMGAASISVQPELRLLPSTKMVLNRYRRPAVG